MRRAARAVRAVPPGGWDLVAALLGLGLIAGGTTAVAGGGVACLVVGAVLLVGAVWPGRRGG